MPSTTTLLTGLGPVFAQAVLAAGIGLWFRLFPFVGYALLTKRVPVLGKVCSALLYAGLTGALLVVSPAVGAGLVILTVGWAYLVVAALATYAVARVRSFELSGGALAVLLGTLYLAVPAIFLRSEPLVFLLALGFDRAFAAFSYCRERRHWPTSHRLSDCMRFLLVDPTLVYVARSQDLMRARITLAAVSRVLLGFGALTAQGCFAGLLIRLGLGYGQRVVWDGALTNFGPAALVVWANQALQYFGHSGVASIQIGSMALLGFRAPERYHYPLFASSPADLWRRWNIYMGLWLQRYMFLPLALRWQRHAPRRPRDLGKAAAVVATFAVCGVAHEVAGYALSFAAPVGAALGFTVCGICIVAWLAVARACWSLLARFRYAPSFAVRCAATVASRAAYCAVLVVFGWLALPALSGGGLPPSLLERLLP
jgi:hypothetical protein